mmetsp:Transcript_29500/g.60277  ORF Transcript_29500/g.60277 Transcript_29500/m.60277 type:complete len:82 (-) Transcript_29500:334-579(-)
MAACISPTVSLHCARGLLEVVAFFKVLFFQKLIAIISESCKSSQRKIIVSSKITEYFEIFLDLDLVILSPMSVGLAGPENK